MKWLAPIATSCRVIVAQFTRGQSRKRREPAMEHLAIDIGGSKCQICVRTADGQVVEERRWPTEELEVYLARRPPSRVILETCAEAFRIADLAKRQGHEVRVVSSLLARALGAGATQTKTDPRDPRRLS